MAEIDPKQLDVGHLALFVGYAFAELTEAELDEAGFGDLRFSHGFVFQHLVDGPKPIGELAKRMKITQQGASKVVVELESMGYVERIPSPEDARVRAVTLTRKAEEAVAKSRKIRAKLSKKLAELHGPEEVEKCRLILAELLDTLGGADAVRGRRVTGPR
jgi:DNA-binding MarR family transcriptional regulator